MIERFRAHPDDGVDPVLLVSSRPDSPAIPFAQQQGMAVLVLDRKSFRETDALLTVLETEGVELIALAGFLWLVPTYLVRAFPDRILNIHPALLPKYGGKGMYGAHVHRAVREAGEKESGITIHYVNERYDEGTILHQSSVALEDTDTPEDIAAKVQALEHEHYWRVVREAAGKL